MKNLYSTILLLTCFAFSSFSQEVFTGSDANAKTPGTSLVKTGKFGSIPQHIIFQPQQQPAFAEAKQWLINNFHPAAGFDLQLLSTEHDKLGMEHFRYMQLSNGLPMEGTMFFFHVKNGFVQSMSGDLYGENSAVTVPVLTESTALQNALNTINATLYKWQVPVEEEFIKKKEKDINATWYPKGNLVYIRDHSTTNGISFRLAYKFDVYAQSPMSRQYIFVDAITGEVIEQIPRIKDADTPATAQTGYSNARPIITDSFAGGYRLREASRGNGIQVLNMLTGTDYGAAVDFTNATTNWNNVNAAEDQYATDAMWAAEITYDYYYLVHGRNSIDGNGFALYNYIHYDVNYLNAFWDGSQMTYGDGSGSYTPLTSPDIGGHEITHGLTEHTANLDYQDESGALNESFSDIFGNTIEGYGRGVINWNIGEDIGTAFRSMTNPAQYNQPDTYHGANWYTGGGDNGGVHTNSGVQNFWYYLLANGGSGINDNGDAYNIAGLGISAAADITFRNLTIYLTNNSQYADSRYWSIQAATDLYGPCSNEVIQVTNAWNAVGVGGPFVFGVAAAFGPAPVTSCTVPLNVQFVNQSNNGGSYIWDFGDGDTSHLNSPVHTYLTGGTFPVTLIADGGVCGIDTFVSNNFVDINLPASPTVVNDSSCVSQSFNLSSSGAGMLYWYNAPLGGNLVNTGNIYSTPVLTTTTYYYVEDHISGGSSSAGPIDNSIGGGNNYTQNFDRFEVFDAYQTFTLVSVKVFAQGAGNRTFRLRDAGGTVIHDTTINVPTGTQVVTLNMQVPQGNGLQLGVLAVANLYRNNGGANYPYTIPGILSITGNTAGGGAEDFWYFVYDWHVATSCISARVPIVALVGSSNVASLTPTGTVSLCDGQSVLFEAGGNGPWLWNTGDTTQTLLVNANGTYYFSETDTVCDVTLHSDTANVTVYPFPYAWFNSQIIGTTINVTDASGNADSWFWNFGDGSTANTSNASHTYSTLGNYAITLIACNGGCCDTSILNVTVTGIGIALHETSDLLIYPNPANGSFHIKNYKPLPGDIISLTDVLGRKSLEASLNENSEIDISSLANGIYFIQVTSIAGNLTGKVVKQ